MSEPIEALELKIAELKEKLEREVDQRARFEMELAIQEFESALKFLKEKGYE